MVKQNVFLITILVFLIVFIAFSVLYVLKHTPHALPPQQPPIKNTTNPPVPSINRTEGACSPESRKAEVCTLIYKPVCGWMDPSKIQCFAYPCAQTYSNECQACQNENVISWTQGECPAVGS